MWVGEVMAMRSYVEMRNEVLGTGGKAILVIKGQRTRLNVILTL
jgi:hypothetical protein